MHQSISAAPSPPRPLLSLRLTPGHFTYFLALDGKFPEAETLELSNSRGWGRKKRENTQSTTKTAAVFTSLSRVVPLLIHVRFFVSINVWPCNSAIFLAWDQAPQWGKKAKIGVTLSPPQIISRLALLLFSPIRSMVPGYAMLIRTSRLDDTSLWL